MAQAQQSSSPQMIYKIEGLLLAKGHITQSGTQKAGAHSMLPLKDVWFENDMAPVPYVSANSVRGKLRRLIMEDLCRQLNYQFSDDRVWHAFFGGGQLKGGGDGMIDAKWRQEIIAKIPPVALWGFSLGNQMIEGKLIVYDMDVCCEENAFAIPAKYQAHCKNSVYQFMSNTFFTRKDDKNDGKIKGEDDPAIQMKVEVQCLVPGTQFYHAFALRHYPSAIEIACLHRAINLWKQIPMIGGKTSSGYGELDLNYDGAIDDAPYLNYLQANKIELVAYMEKMTDAMRTKLEKMAGRKVVRTKKSKVDPKAEPASEKEKKLEGDDNEPGTDEDDSGQDLPKTKSNSQTTLPV